LQLSPTRCFTDLNRALGEVDADAILNVTPPQFHKEIALKAFKRRLHVLTEKPLADGMASGKEMVAAAREAGCTLMVSQNYRFRRWARTMMRIVAEKQVGQVNSCVVRFAKAPAFTGSYRLQMDFPLIVDMSVHHFDLMRAILGQDPVDIFVKSWNPPWSWFRRDARCAILIGMTGGVNVIYDASWVTRGIETSWDGEWRVEGAAGTVELRGDKVILCKDAKKEEVVESAQLPAENQDYSILEFKRAIETKAEPETSGARNLPTLAMIFAALDSAQTVQPKKIADYLG
jgi:predicted dehydrogenase